METAETRKKLADAVRDLEKKGDKATAQKLVNAYKVKYAAPAPAPQQEELQPLSDRDKGMSGRATGFVQSYLGALQNAGNLIVKPLDAAWTAITGKQPVQTGLPKELLQARTKEMQQGQVVGNVSQFLAPIGSVNKATSALSYVPKILARTAPDVVTSYLQTNGDKKATQGTGLTSLVTNAILPGSGSVSALKQVAAGYAADVASGVTGMRGEDRTGSKAFIPGLGTAIGTTIGVGGNVVSSLGNKTKVNNTIARHFAEAKDVTDNLSPEQIAKLGGNTALFDRTKTNIVDGLRAEGSARYADAISSIDTKSVANLDDLYKKVVDTLNIAGEGQVLANVNRLAQPSEKAVANAVDNLEETYRNLTGGTKSGLKRQSKVDAKVEAQNKAGTTGRQPERVLAESGIVPDFKGTKLYTVEQAENLRGTTAPLREANRKSLAELDTMVAPSRLDDLEAKAIEYSRTPENINSGRADKMEKEIRREFDILRKEYPTGEIPLTVVDDIKSARWDNVFKNKGLVDADVLRKDSEYAIAKSLQKQIEEVASNAGNKNVAQLNREIGDILDASKYLDSLHGNTLKGGKLLKYLTTMIGSSFGQSLFGKVIGAFGGNLVGDVIIHANLSNPIKRWVLRSVKNKDPEVYLKTIEWLAKQKDAKANRLLLPAGDKKAIQLFDGIQRDASGKIKEYPASALPAESYVSGDPKTGRFQKIYTAQSKSPKSQQTIPATMSVSNIDPIIPPTKTKRTFLPTGADAKRGFIKNPLATESKLPKSKVNESVSSLNDSIDLKTKREVILSDVSGNKVKVPEGTVLKAGTTKGSNMIVEVNGKQYTVNKNQYQNLKGQSLVAEAKEFAPELKGTEDTIKGESKTASFNMEDYEKFPPEVTKIMDKYYDDTEAIAKALEKKGYVVNMTPDFEITGFYKKGTSPAKYSQYTLPNGENYREILIKAPTKEKGNFMSLEDFTKESKQAGLRDENVIKNKYQEYLGEKGNASYSQSFKSSHWDEPNVISHLRINDRTYNGKKLVFMEELQSDWAREARKNGIRNPELVDKIRKYPVPKDEGAWSQNVLVESGVPKELASEYYKTSMTGVPNNPLLKNWQEPTIKRALQDAVQNDAKYFAWINGDQTSARYNLATHVDDVEWKPVKREYDNNSYKDITLKPKESKTPIKLRVEEDGMISYSSQGDWSDKQLDEVLGKGLADKIMEKESGSLAGDGLKFGGEWASNLYDKQVKNIVEDLTGAKVKEFDLGLPVDNKANFQEWTVLSSQEKLNPSNLKKGLEISGNPNASEGQKWVVTSVGKNGTFEAVNKTQMGKDYWEAETFDISQKTTKQQGIELTPEIVARIRGEAPSFKSKLPKNAVATASIPLIFAFFMNPKDEK